MTPKLKLTRGDSQTITGEPPFTLDDTLLRASRVPPLLIDPLEKILSRFTISKAPTLKTEPHIDNLLTEIRAQESRGKGFAPIECDDPVHGKHTIPAWMVGVIATPPLLRLASIRQMPLTEHSRLAHSIGVALLAFTVAEKLDLEEQETKELVLSGLLHDIGHAAHSHVYEEIYLSDKSEFFDHDTQRMALIRSKTLSNTLREIELDPQAIAEALNNPLKNWVAYLAKVLLDRVDYLCRDTAYAKVEGIDISAIKKISNSFLSKIEYGCINDSKQVYFSHDALPEIGDFIRARRGAFKCISYDPTSNIIDSLISRSIRAKLALIGNEEVKVAVARGLSLFNDSQLNAQLDLPSQRALETALTTKSVPLLAVLRKEDVAPDYQQIGTIKKQMILNALGDIDPKVTWLVSIRPDSSPSIEIRIKTEQGEIRDISDKQQVTQVGYIAIAAFYPDGTYCKASDTLCETIRRKFKELTWLT